jgi:DNA-binding PadR family transcriptional regulator
MSAANRAVPEDFLPLTPLSFEIMLSLADGARHGYGIIKEVEERSGEPLRSSTGTLYLAIQRLQKNGLLAVAAQTGAKASRGRTYVLTPLGRKVAAAEAERLAARVHDARLKFLLPGDAASEAATGGND